MTTGDGSPNRSAAGPAGSAVTPVKLFLTGDPGCGKTTAIRRVVERLRGSVPMTGFLTGEIREEGRRLGFQGTTLDGRVFPLAGADAKGPLRVGPYGVTLEGLETIGIPSLVPSAETRLVVLDEVGKMESFSEPFRRAVENLLSNETPLLASVALHGVGFVKRIRHDRRIILLQMSRESRDAVVGDLLRRLADAGIPGKTAVPLAGRDRQVDPA